MTCWGGGQTLCAEGSPEAVLSALVPLSQPIYLGPLRTHSLPALAAVCVEVMFTVPP